MQIDTHTILILLPAVYSLFLACVISTNTISAGLVFKFIPVMLAIGLGAVAFRLV